MFSHFIDLLFLIDFVCFISNVLFLEFFIKISNLQPKRFLWISKVRQLNLGLVNLRTQILMNFSHLNVQLLFIIYKSFLIFLYLVWHWIQLFFLILLNLQYLHITLSLKTLVSLFLLLILFDFSYFQILKMFYFPRSFFQSHSLPISYSTHQN